MEFMHEILCNLSKEVVIVLC